MPPRENVLAVPSEAVTSDDGQDVCFVIHDEDVERRPVTLGRVTQEMTEVTAGLHEGEQVVLNPHPQDLEPGEDPEPSPVASSEPPVSRDASPSDVAALR